VMGHFVTGVSVVTARDPGGAPVGTTVNAVTSVSLDPPLLLVCLARRSETLTSIRAEGTFAVNVLSAEQRHHSDRFAKKGTAVLTHEVPFQDHDNGVPTLADALATLVCEVWAIHPAGDHDIVIGQVGRLDHAGHATRPLLFYRGSYTRLITEEEHRLGWSG
jgi:3-hydroxy-9,10-secoandrosta-1,3,5(10)-triene-9,17-dione monooxygenase reductase component